MPTVVLPLRQRGQSGGSMDLLQCPLARRRRRRRWTTYIDTQLGDLRDEAGDRVVVDADGQLGDSRPVLRPVDHAGGSSGCLRREVNVSGDHRRVMIGGGHAPGGPIATFLGELPGASGIK
jgi:hypothetical protein